jgi:FkbM family methyltransferase
MLIPFPNLMQQFKMNVTGILHIGAHECEELKAYNSKGVNNVYWVEAMQEKVDLMKSRGVQNIYQAVIDEEDNKEVIFNITNNGQSSSILEFGSHEKNHPQVHVIKQEPMITTRMDTLIEKHNIPMETINFINLDIQGVELRALKSMEKHLNTVDYIYTEVNTEEVYKGCDLMTNIDEYLLKFDFVRVNQNIYKQFGWGDAIYIRKSAMNV